MAEIVSRPSRARGLKLAVRGPRQFGQLVAPLAGAWIETPSACPQAATCSCRAPRGRVD